MGSKLKRLSTWSIWPMVENSGFQADLRYCEWHVGFIIAILLYNNYFCVFKLWTFLQGTESKVATFLAETCVMSHQSISRQAKTNSEPLTVCVCARALVCVSWFQPFDVADLIIKSVFNFTMWFLNSIKTEILTSTLQMGARWGYKTGSRVSGLFRSAALDPVSSTPL